MAYIEPDSSLLGGVDTSPLYGFYKGGEIAGQGIRNLSNTLNKYGEAKASDATAAAIAAITGADSREAYNQLKAEELTQNPWLSGTEKQALMNQLKAQKDVATKTEQDAYMKQLNDSLTKEQLAQYGSAQEASRALLGNVDPTLFNMQERDALAANLQSLYGNQFGMTEAQKAEAEILEAENQSLIDVQAQKMKQELDKELVNQGYSRDFIMARNEVPEQALSINELVQELEPRFGSDADAGKIQKILDLAKEEGVQLNSQDIKNIYELGSDNNWFGKGSKDFQWWSPISGAGKGAAKDYIQKVKNFNNSPIAETYGNLEARVESAKKQMQRDLRKNQEAQYNAQNRGVSNANMGAGKVENISDYLREYTRYNDILNSLKP
jgi:hypothetical protein